MSLENQSGRGIVHLHGRIHSEHNRLPRRILLGNPRHSPLGCGWATIEVRRAVDGNGYTYSEFQKEHGERAKCCWDRATVPKPVSSYYQLTDWEKKACSRVLCVSLRKKYDLLHGRMVITKLRTVREFPEVVQQLIAGFITIDHQAVRSMLHFKQRFYPRNKSLRSIGL